MALHGAVLEDSVAAVARRLVRRSVARRCAADVGAVHLALAARGSIPVRRVARGGAARAALRARLAAAVGGAPVVALLERDAGAHAPLEVPGAAVAGARRAPSEGPTEADLERAIVAAMLDGRGVVAEMLAERLKARRLAAAGVVRLPTQAKS